jgi:hypothetical protein
MKRNYNGRLLPNKGRRRTGKIEFTSCKQDSLHPSQSPNKGGNRTTNLFLLQKIKFHEIFLAKILPQIIYLFIIGNASEQLKK